MKFFVSPPEKSRWTMAPSDFIANLVTRWPDARVHKLTQSPYFSHEWEIEMAHGTMEGKFYTDGPGVALDAVLEDCVEFALWFRSLAPADQELWFFDESFSAHVDLKPNTSAATIAAAFE